MTPVQMIVRDLARQGIEPTRRLVRAQLAARHITATDAEIDRVLAVELQRWIVDPGKVTKAKTSVAYRNAAKQRNHRNTWIKSNDPAFWDKPTRGA